VVRGRGKGEKEQAGSGKRAIRGEGGKKCSVILLVLSFATNLTKETGCKRGTGVKCFDSEIFVCAKNV
jgi:hypothetical protein